MNLGLVGVNTITEMLIHFKKVENIKFCIYDDDVNKHGKLFFGALVKSSLHEIEKDFKNNQIDALHICLGEKYLSLKKILFENVTLFLPYVFIMPFLKYLRAFFELAQPFLKVLHLIEN